MRTTHLTPADYRVMPWKNGLGVTTEIARHPAEGEFDWRVSSADVTSDGPFSMFPGCDRVIVTLTGAGMKLTHREPGTNVVVGSLGPWTFSGDWTTDCVLLDGPIRDFNVIVRRDVFSADVNVLRVDADTTINCTAKTLLYCVAGMVNVASVRLRPEETLIVSSDAYEAITLRPDAPGAILIRVDLA